MRLKLDENLGRRAAELLRQGMILVRFQSKVSIQQQTGKLLKQVLLVRGLEYQRISEVQIERNETPAIMLGLPSYDCRLDRRQKTWLMQCKR